MKRIIFILVVLCILLTGCTRKSAQAVSTWAGGIGREWDVNSADSQIYNYRWFYDQYGLIKSTAQNIKVSEGILDPVEIAGMKMNLNAFIEDYNQRARRVEDAARFMADELPERIRLSDFGLE